MRSAGNDEVLTCRVMTYLFPSENGMMELSRQFLMANPTTCSLVSSVRFPFRKKVKCFSLMEPGTGSSVSWRATISIYSLCSF